MKIALCLSGQPRFLEKGYQGLYQKLLNNKQIHQIDVFAHLWWDNSYQNDIIKLHSLERYPCVDLGKEFLNLYRPKECIIEKYKTFCVKDYNLTDGEQSSMLHSYHKEFFSKSLIISQKSSYYSVKQSLRMALKSDTKYDWYIRARTDLTIDKEIDFNSLHPKRVNVDLPNVDFANHQIPDTFGIGTEQPISEYACIYDKIDEISKNYVICSTRYLERGLVCGIKSHDWKVSIIRNPDFNKHMDTYLNDNPKEILPGWLKTD